MVCFQHSTFNMGRRVDELMSGRDTFVGLQNCTRSCQKPAQESQRRPKAGLREPKMTQNEARGAPQRLHGAPKRPNKNYPKRQDETRTEQRRSQDRLGSPSGGRATPSLVPPQGLHLGPPNGTKTDPQTIKTEANIQTKAVEHVMLGDFVSNIRRFEDGSWTNLGRQRRARF